MENSKVTIKKPALNFFSLEAFWVGAGQIGQVVATLVCVRLLTAYLTEAEYGKLALITALALSARDTVGTSLFSTGSRFFSLARESASSEWYTRAIHNVLRKYSVLVFFCIVVLVMYGLLSGRPILWIEIASGVFLSFLFVVHLACMSLQNGARHRKATAFHQNLIGWSRPLFITSIFYLGFNTVLGALASYILAVAAGILSEYYYLKKRLYPVLGQGTQRVDRTAEFSRYLKPLMLAGALGWIQLSADRWILSIFGSLAMVGIYFAMYQISYSPAFYIFGFLNHYLSPIFFEKAGVDKTHAENYRGIQIANLKIGLCLLLGTLIGFVFLTFFHQTICSLLLDQSFTTHSWALPWIFLTGSLMLMGNQLLISEYAGLTTHRIMFFRAVSAFLSIIIYSLGLYTAGFHGFIFGGVIFAAIHCGLSYVLFFLRFKSCE